MTAALYLCVRRSAPPLEPSMPVSVALRLPSDVTQVEDAVELMARHCFAGRRPCSRTAFRLRVALAEALSNAIVFGNQEDPTKQVTVIAELFPELIRLCVADEGLGFDPIAIPQPTDPDGLERPCGRGLFIIRNLVDQLEFNERGNAIWMTLPRC